MFETVQFLIKKIFQDRTAAIGVFLILGLILVAIFAPILATHPADITEFHPPERLQGPSGTFFWN